MTSLSHQIGVGCAGFAIVCIANLFFESKRDRNAAREELNATNRILREERLDEEYNDPEKRGAFIEQKIVKRLCRQRNINRFPISIRAGAGCNTDKESYFNTADSSSTSSEFSSDEEDGHAQEQQKPENADTINAADNTDNVCSVCLEPFCQGEEVAWSRELKCQHCFHSECLVPWLMKHGECPVCRIEFFNKEDFSDNSDRQLNETNAQAPLSASSSLEQEGGVNIPTTTSDEEMGRTDSTIDDLVNEEDYSFEIVNGQVEIRKC
jgi:hypothetical protein